MFAVANGAGSYPAQVTVAQLASNLLYIMAATAVVLVVVGLILVDIGLVQRRNVLGTAIQKFVGFLIGTFSYLFYGFAIWQWQFYKALGVQQPYAQALHDWWLAGPFTTTYAHALSPDAAPTANSLQIFIVFLALYGGFICVLVHFGGSERLRPLPYYLMCVGIGAVIYPFLLWLTWGSTSPITNLGVHDFLGIFVAYIFAGCFAAILAMRLGPRAGLIKPHPVTGPWVPYNISLSVVGVGLVLFAIPFVVMGCGYFIPGTGYVGIAMTTSGIGIVYVNVFTAFAAGAITGTLLSYWRRDPVHLALGPLSGYIGGSGGFDVLNPWQTLLIALFAPIFVFLVHEALVHRHVDERKIVPLGVGAGLFGAIIVGFVAWGTPTGGYIGITSGPYAFQHAQITPYWQLLGIGVTVGAALLAGVVLVVGLEKAIGIRVSDAEEIQGLDSTRWGMTPVGAEIRPSQASPGGASQPREEYLP